MLWFVLWNAASDVLFYPVVEFWNIGYLTIVESITKVILISDNRS